MRGIVDAGLLLVEKVLLLLHADEDDAAAAAAALFPVDEAARITVAPNTVGVIGMVSIDHGQRGTILRHRQAPSTKHAKRQSVFVHVAELLFFGGNKNPLLRLLLNVVSTSQPIKHFRIQNNFARIAPAMLTKQHAGQC